MLGITLEDCGRVSYGMGLFETSNLQTNIKILDLHDIIKVKKNSPDNSVRIIYA